MGEIIINAKGVNGQIELCNESVYIRRKGLISLLSPGLKGDKEIIIRDIASVHFKKAGKWGNGFIQFVPKGDKVNQESLLRWIQDAHTVIFNAGHQHRFEEIRDFVAERI